MTNTVYTYFKQVNVENYMQFLMKQRLSKLPQQGPMKLRNEIIDHVVNMLTTYRTKCAQNSQPTQLVMPDSLKLMPIYLLAMLKNHALRLMTSSRQLDVKESQAQMLLGAPFAKMAYLFYPRVYRVTNVMEVVGYQREIAGDRNRADWGYFTDTSEATIVKPKVLTASFEKIQREEAYILDNGEFINFFVCSMVPDEFVQQVFGYNDFQELAHNIESGVTPYAPIESEASQIIHSLLEQLRYEKGGTAGAYAPIRIFLDGDKGGLTRLYDECLIEDAVDPNAEFPYQEFLRMLHKRIRTKLAT